MEEVNAYERSLQVDMDFTMEEVTTYERSSQETDPEMNHDDMAETTPMDISVSVETIQAIVDDILSEGGGEP